MFKHDECNKALSEECLKFIDIYRGTKENNISDAFYHKHLDCFVSLIEDWKEQEKDSFAVIMSGKEAKYVTVTSNNDSITFTLTTSIYDATKFFLNSSDLYLLLDRVKDSFTDKEFEVIYINKKVFGDSQRQVWKDCFYAKNDCRF